MHNIFDYSEEDIKNLVKIYEEEIKENKFLDTFIDIDSKTSDDISEDIILAVDIGGSFLKLGLIRISKLTGYEFIKEIKKFRISKGGFKNADLFDWVSEKCAEYLGDDRRNYKIAMTFSYAMRHTSLKNGRILGMGKDFPFKPINNSELKDPSILLQNALKKRNIGATVEALLNDATATFLASYFLNKNTFVGIVLGTGTNGAFIENKDEAKGRVFNTEWGSFNHEKLKKTKSDRKIEEKILKEGKIYNCLDCMIGGYKFIELLNISEKTDIKACQEDINLQDIINSLDKNVVEPINPCVLESSVSKLIVNIKTRSVRILACLVVSLILSYQTEDDVVISLNGSILEHPFDRDIFQKEISYIAAMYDKLKDKTIKCVFIENASLIGSAYAVIK